jgi:hypothetical protein
VRPVEDRQVQDPGELRGAAAPAETVRLEPSRPGTSPPAERARTRVPRRQDVRPLPWSETKGKSVRPAFISNPWNPSGEERVSGVRRRALDVQAQPVRKAIVPDLTVPEPAVVRLIVAGPKPRGLTGRRRIGVVPGPEDRVGRRQASPDSEIPEPARTALRPGPFPGRGRAARDWLAPSPPVRASRGPVERGPAANRAGRAAAPPPVRVEPQAGNPSPVPAERAAPREAVVQDRLPAAPRARRMAVPGHAPVESAPAVQAESAIRFYGENLGRLLVESVVPVLSAPARGASQTLCAAAS